MLQIQVALLCVRSLYLLLSRSGFQSGDREPFLEGCFYIYTIGISYTQSRYLIYTAALHLLYSSFRWGQARRQVLVFWGAQYIVGERFGFYCMFETNFLGPKNLRGQKNWGGAPLTNAAVATGLDGGCWVRVGCYNGSRYKKV